MALRRSGLLLFRQISAYHQPSTLLSKSGCEYSTLFSNNAVVASSFPVSLNHVRQLSFTSVWYNNASENQPTQEDKKQMEVNEVQPTAEQKNQMAKEAFNQLQQDLERLLINFNDQVVKYFASTTLEDLDVTITMEDGKVCNVKHLGTIKYELPFFASLDLNHNPSIIPEVKLALNRLDKAVKQQGNVLLFELPAKSKDENEMNETRKELFKTFIEESKSILSTYATTARSYGLKREFQAATMTARIETRADLIWKVCEFGQQVNNARLTGKPYNIFAVKVKLLFLQYKNVVINFLFIFCCSLLLYHGIKWLFYRKPKAVKEQQRKADEQSFSLDD